MPPKRILVVDDEPNTVKSCARILEPEGFEVQGVTSGAEAIELCRRRDFDLILTDLKMPGVNGLGVLTALKEYNSDAAVVIFTAYGTKESAVEALRLGACEFLEKPLSAKTLIATVRHILERGDSAMVRGNLRILSLPSIIQINCTEHNQARLRLKHQGQEGSIFFKDGNVVHSVFGSQVGEETVYELLTWKAGDFELEMGVPPPEQTINASWPGLLLEGMRRLDETQAKTRNGLAESEQVGREALLAQPTPEQEVLEMTEKKRSEVLADILSDLLAASTDMEGAVVVSHDGLVIASNMPRGTDEARVGATTAALLGLSKRSTPTLGRGNFIQSLVQGENGNIVIISAGEQAVFVGLTVKDANLGMVFLEARDTAATIAAAL
ncbi:MAG: response regulator [Chloroflexota bacterium]|nr:response regulator [Chloroflexota bacterium]